MNAKSERSEGESSNPLCVVPLWHASQKLRAPGVRILVPSADGSRPRQAAPSQPAPKGSAKAKAKAKAKAAQSPPGQRAGGWASRPHCFP